MQERVENTATHFKHLGRLLCRLALQPNHYLTGLVALI
jgi:hypothetical protein